MTDTSESFDRALRVEGLVNARDLGGLRRVDGSVTPKRVFYRSENVDSITPAGWEQVYQNGIRTIVDLRDRHERARDRTTRPVWIQTEVVELNGFEDKQFWKGYLNNGLVHTALYYLAHLEAMPERSVAAISAIVSAPPGGVLFHCVAGRDRAGMISMLLLLAADTERDEIVDDYLETVRLGELRAAWSFRGNEEPAIEAICRSFGTTVEDAFRSTLEELDVNKWLAHSGIEADASDRLKSWRGHISP